MIPFTIRGVVVITDGTPIIHRCEYIAGVCPITGALFAVTGIQTIQPPNGKDIMADTEGRFYKIKITEYYGKGN